MLAYEDAQMPTVRANDVLIRVVANSVNPIDRKLREGHLKEVISYDFPLILGRDVSGVVDAIGDSVTRFEVGDAVCSRPDIKRNGTYAEYVAVAENEVAHKPKTNSYTAAASLPLAGITGWQALIATAHISAN